MSFRAKKKKNIASA